MKQSPQRTDALVKVVAVLAALPLLGACGSLMSLPTQLLSRSASTAPAAPSSTADVGASTSQPAATPTEDNADGGDSLIEDPFFFSNCTFQRHDGQGHVDEKQPIDKATRQDYPVLESMGMAKDAHDYTFVHLKYKAPIEASKETTITIFPTDPEKQNLPKDDKQRQFMQIRLARNTITSTTYGRGDPAEKLASREPATAESYFAWERYKDPRYSNNDVIIAHIDKQYMDLYRMESVVRMQTDTTISECAYNPDDPRNTSRN